MKINLHHKQASGAGAFKDKSCDHTSRHKGAPAHIKTTTHKHIFATFTHTNSDTHTHTHTHTHTPADKSGAEDNSEQGNLGTRNLSHASPVFLLFYVRWFLCRGRRVTGQSQSNAATFTQHPTVVTKTRHTGETRRMTSVCHHLHSASATRIRNAPLCHVHATRATNTMVVWILSGLN